MTVLYLPIEEPLGRPTVHPFGKDFGNGALDQRYFQPGTVDLPATLAVSEAEHVHEAALAWIGATLERERGFDTAAIGASRDGYAHALQHVAEDVVVLHRGAGDGRIEALHVRAPSGWRPERALGATMTELHGGVPGLLDRASGETLTRMMIDRGPYVRFVWGVHTCGALDHHPDRVVKARWEDAERAYLRVERQVTIPLRHVDAAIFLIRVYVHPLEALEDDALHRLDRAIGALPDVMRAYKGLPKDPRLVSRFFLR